MPAADIAPYYSRHTLIFRHFASFRVSLRQPPPQDDIDDYLFHISHIS